MSKKIFHFLLIAAAAVLWISSTGCNMDGEAIVIVKNNGPASIVIYFIDVTTKLDEGESETYVVTLPGKNTQQQILAWYPIIHPNKKYYQSLTLEDGKGQTIVLSYDPVNPPDEE